MNADEGEEGRNKEKSLISFYQFSSKQKFQEGEKQKDKTKENRRKNKRESYSSSRYLGKIKSARCLLRSRNLLW